jgi:Ger(x)C family germination protein
MAKRVLLVILIVPLLFTATSCWDQLEIEDLAFVIGLAIDHAEEPDKITVTFQIAQPKAFVAESQGTEPYWNVTETAEDVTAAINTLARNINWIPTMEHCQVILIGEGLARKGLKEHMDFALRTHEVRRRVKIGVVQGRAQEVLEMKFNSGLIPSFVISEMMTFNSQYSFEVTNFMSIGSLHIAIEEDYDFILSRIIPMKDKLDMSGGAVFKDFQLVGWLSGEELTGARFLRGDVSGGSLKKDLPPDMGKRVILRVFEAQSSLRPEIRDGKLYAVLNLRLEGDIDEIIDAKSDLDAEELIIKTRRLMQDSLENSIDKTYEKVKDEFESDPFRLKEKTKSYYPDFWEKNKDNWDEIYQASELEIESFVRIRRIGEIKN